MNHTKTDKEFIGPTEVSFEMEEKIQLQQKNKNIQSSIPPHVYYLKCFFDLGYFVLVIPFRFRLTWNSTSRRNEYQLHKNKLHQIICGVFQAFIVFEFISILRLIPGWTELNQKRINILHSGNLIACLIYSVSLIYVFWFKQTSFQKIFQQIQHEGSIFEEKKPTTNDFWRTLKVKGLCYGICLVGYAVALTHPIIHGAFIFPEGSNNDFFDKMRMQAQACYLMSNPYDMQWNTTSTESNDISTGLYSATSLFFTLIHIGMIIPSTVLVHMLDLFALLTTICCWHVVASFVSKICIESNEAFEDQFSDHEKAAMIISKYSELKDFMKTVNDATGLVFLCCIGISLPFYASWTAVQFFEDEIDWFETIHFYVYFVSFLGVLTLAASVNRRANTFYDWVTSSNLVDVISPNKLTTFMMDFYSNRIALSGCGVFVLTFRFFVTILSIIVTYTSIIVQFQIGRRDSTLFISNSTM